MPTDVAGDWQLPVEVYLEGFGGVCDGMFYVIGPCLCCLFVATFCVPQAKKCCLRMHTVLFFIETIALLCPVFL